MQKTIVFTLTIITLFWLFLPLSQARESAISITPPVMEILLKPGKSVIQAFNIQNQGETADFTAEIVKIMPIDSYGHTTTENYQRIPELEITLQNADREFGKPFALQAGESSQLVVKLNAAPVAGDVEAKDYYLGLALANSTPGCQTDFQKRCTDLTPTLVSLLLVTVTPTDKLPVSLEIDNWLLPRLADSFSPLLMDITVKNKSTAMIRPTGSVAITDFLGRTVHKQTLYPHLILAGHNRTLQGLSGELNSEITADLQATPLSWTPGWRLGPHQITLTLQTASGDTIIESGKTIFLLPYKLLLISLILIFIFSATIIRKIRNSEPDHLTS